MRQAYAILLTLILPLRLAAAPDAFLSAHCYDCHDGDTQKAGLRLDTLKLTPKTAEVWAEIYHRVSHGEMPPKKKAQPSAASSQAFLSELKAQLLTADRGQKKTAGRVVLRRLNRTEYENTINDLFGLRLDLKPLLPEDASKLGFDNIADALSLSSVLMERYLETADLALDAVLTTLPRPEPQHWDVDLMPQRLRTDVRDYRLSGAKVLPDKTFILFKSDFQPVTLEQVRPPLAGFYKFRVHASGYQCKDKPVPLAMYAGSFDSKNYDVHLQGLYDLEDGKERVIEFTAKLPAKGTIKPIPYRLKSVLKTGIPTIADDYPGPGAAIHRIEVDGPLLDTWPPLGQQQMLGGVDLSKGTAADAGRALRWLAPRAFRRPVSEAEIAPYMSFVQERLDAGSPFDVALRAGLKAILCSPEFLYFKEKPGALTDYALATRLAFFLWSSTPDDKLLDLAAKGTLRQSTTLHAQVERLLADAKAQRFTDNFTGQWLGLRNINFTTPDKKIYPEHDDVLEDSMVRETKLFFTELLTHDLSVINFLDSDFTLLNARLAELYGIEGVHGHDFRKVSLLPEHHRGGVITQAAILKITANGSNTSPVIRGNWMLKNIVGRPVKPPPPNVPAIEPDIRGATTIREQLAKHRAIESCAACHDKMDPLGLALESYDVIGQWRDAYRLPKFGGGPEPKVYGFQKGLPVDCTGTLSTGASFANLADLKKLLLLDKEQIARNIAEKLLTYATGAGLSFADKAAMDDLLKKSTASQWGLRTMIHQIVQSEAFQTK